MLFQRICAPAYGRTDLPQSAITSAMLNQARQSIGAGPLWGRPAAAILVPSYAAVVLLATRAGRLSPGMAIAAVGGTIAVLALAVTWCRGVDVNAWLEADPRHRRGSCQWLIWRGEYSGRPCLACLASMPRRERRRWLEASASPAVAAGWLSGPDTSPDSRPAALRDAGRVEVEALLFRMAPPFLLLVALVNATAGDDQLRLAVWPLLAGAILMAWLGHNARRSSDRDSTAIPKAGDVPECESCRRAPGTVTVTFLDAVTFHVCALCLTAGSHAIPAHQAVSAETRREVQS